MKYNIDIPVGPPEPVEVPVNLRFVRGDKGMRVDAVDTHGHLISKLVSFRDDGQLRVYGNIASRLGFQMSYDGHLKQVSETGH